MTDCAYSVGPLDVPAAATNILSPGTTTGGVASLSGTPLYIKLFFIRLNNRTNVDATVTLFLGASGATVSGTELSPASVVVPANSEYDLPFPGGRTINNGTFLVGVASVDHAVTLDAWGRIGIFSGA